MPTMKTTRFIALTLVAMTAKALRVDDVCTDASICPEGTSCMEETAGTLTPCGSSPMDPAEPCTCRCKVGGAGHAACEDRYSGGTSYRCGEGRECEDEKRCQETGKPDCKKKKKPVKKSVAFIIGIGGIIGLTAAGGTVLWHRKKRQEAEASRAIELAADADNSDAEVAPATEMTAV